MNAAKWVIFSTFDVEGLPDQPAVEQLADYRAAGFKTLVVDTSPVVSEARRQQWESVATRWRHRENVGYDFGSYKFGLDYLLRDEHEEIGRLDLVFTNDSCFGPFVSLPDVFKQFDSRPDEPDVVYGMSDSIQQGHHIQSYWVYFRAAACHHAENFFDAMIPADGRDQAIEFGELAFGAFLRQSKCRLIVWCPWDETVARMSLGRGRLVSTLEFLLRRATKRWKYGYDADTQCLRWLLNFPTKMKYFNPPVLFGVQLFKDGKTPFVKKSMLRENVYRSPDIPPGLKVRGMSNSDVRRLLEAPRR